MAEYPPAVNPLPSIFNPDDFYQESDVDNLKDVLIEGNNAGAKQINMNNNKITFCADPTQSQDVATKNYVDLNDGGTLQQTLDLGNTATGATAKIGLTNNDVGYVSSPQITLNNSRSDAGNSVGVPTTEYFKSGRNVVANDIVGSTLYYAKNYLGVKTLFGKTECVATSTGLNNDDGALDFYSCVNGINNLVFRLNGADNENNSFRPLDLNGNALKTSQANMAIEATASSGTGQITIAPKTSSNLIIGTIPAGTNRTIVNADGTGLNLQNVNSGFTGVVSLVNQVVAQSYLLISQTFGSLLKRIYLISDATGVGGNSLDSSDLQHPDVPFKIKTDNGSFASSNSSLEIDMNPVNDATVKAQLTFTHDNTLIATSPIADHYLPIMIAGTQYYIPITTSAT